MQNNWKAQAAKDYISFPQANSLERIVDLVRTTAPSEAAYTIHDVALKWGVSGRQGQYYYAAARYLDLVQLINGYVKPTSAGSAFLENSRDGWEASLAAIIFERRVFAKTAISMLRPNGIMTDGDIARLVQYEDPNLCEQTAMRRANTVKSWVGYLCQKVPSMVAEMAPRWAYV